MFIAMLALHLLGVVGLVAFYYFGKDAPITPTKSSAPSPATTPPQPRHGDAATSAAPTPAGAQPMVPKARPIPENYRSHMIQSSETWESVAQHYQITPDALKAANPGIDWLVGRTIQVPPVTNVISVGATNPHGLLAKQANALQIPNNQEMPRVNYALNDERVASLLPSPLQPKVVAPTVLEPERRPTPGPLGGVVKASGSQKFVNHTVGPRETLFRIAQQYDTTVQRIAAANGITDYSKIQQGMKLRIPQE